MPVRNCFLLLCSLLLPLMGLHAQVQNPDYYILRQIARTRTEGLNDFFILVSDLNNPVCIGVLVVLILTRWMSVSRLYYRTGILVTGSIVIGQLITHSTKFLIGRLRPQLYDTSFLSVINPTNKSFPSGHTSEAFGMALAVCYMFPQWWIRLPAMGWACLIAYARLYLGVHYPSDILGGVIVAAFSTWLMLYFMARANRGKPLSPGNDADGNDELKQ